MLTVTTVTMKRTKRSNIKLSSFLNFKNFLFKVVSTQNNCAYKINDTQIKDSPLSNTFAGFSK
jgi:hypothetical protein